MTNSTLERILKNIGLGISSVILATSLYTTNINAQEIKRNPNTPIQRIGPDCGECDKEKKEPKTIYTNPRTNENPKKQDTVYIINNNNNTFYIPQEPDTVFVPRTDTVFVPKTDTIKVTEYIETNNENTNQQIDNANNKNYLGAFAQKTNNGIMPGIHYGRDITRDKNQSLETGIFFSAGYSKNRIEENSPVGSTKTSTIFLEPGIYTMFNFNENFGIGLTGSLNIQGDNVREELYHPKTKNLIKQKDHDTQWSNSLGYGIVGKAAYKDTEFRVGIKRNNQIGTSYNAGISYRF